MSLLLFEVLRLKDKQEVSRQGSVHDNHHIQQSHVGGRMGAEKWMRTSAWWQLKEASQERRI